MGVLDFPDAVRWESWLAAQHGVRTEAWLRIAKRHSGISTITIAEALDVARYAVILPLLKARTPQARARILAQALARLAAQQ